MFQDPDTIVKFCIRHYAMLAFQAGFVGRKHNASLRLYSVFLWSWQDKHVDNFR